MFLAQTVAQLLFRCVILVLCLSNKCLSVSHPRGRVTSRYRKVVPRKAILPHVGRANPLHRVTCLARANLVKVFPREVHLRHSKLSRPLEGSSPVPRILFIILHLPGWALVATAYSDLSFHFLYGLFLLFDYCDSFHPVRLVCVVRL